jgi:lysophospholipase L1-like esterase
VAAGVARTVGLALAVGLAFGTPCAAAADGPEDSSRLVVVEGDSISTGKFLPDPGARYSDLLARVLGVPVLNVATDGESLAVSQPHRIPYSGMAYTWDRQVLARDPAVIVLMSGSNDVRFDFASDIDARVDLFERLLRGMLDAARSHVNPDGSHPVVIVMSPPPARAPGQVIEPVEHFTSSRIRGDMDQLVARAAAVAADYPEVRWVDNYHLWQALSRKQKDPAWFVKRLTFDGVHPNEFGHRLIARTLLPVLADALRTATPRESTAPRPGG